MKRAAVIDIGSNSVKFFLGEKQDTGEIKTILDQNDVLRLGEGLRESGCLSRAAMERNAAAVARFARAAQQQGADKILAVGTMALRSAANSADFLAMVERLCGVRIEVITGEEEARLSYLAVLSGFGIPEGEVVVFDTGGGSTEFIYGHGTDIINRFSIDVGSIRVTEKFFPDDPVKRECVEMAAEAVRAEFSAVGTEGKPVRLVGIGGTVTTMAAVRQGLSVYDPALIQGSFLTREDVSSQINTYAAATLAQRRTIAGLHAGRVDIILGGACIVKAIMDRLCVEKLMVSDRGVRHGLAFEALCGS